MKKRRRWREVRRKKEGNEGKMKWREEGKEEKCRKEGNEDKREMKKNDNNRRGSLSKEKLQKFHWDEVIFQSKTLYFLAIYFFVFNKKGNEFSLHSFCTLFFHTKGNILIIGGLF